MSNYPEKLDDDTTLPIVNDNLTQIGGAAINGLRDAVFQLEQYVGTNPTGVTIESRLGLLVSQSGTINSSVITALGLVTLPITQNQIADNAGIPESKLHLDYRTQDLFNYIRDLSRDVNSALGWISVSGVKLEPHLVGFIYRHDLSQIDVTENSALFLNNKFRAARNNTNAFTVINDINNELLAHQWADGSPFGTIQNVITNDGSTYPSNFAHTASGIFLQTSIFNTIPQTANNMQLFAEFVDSSSLLLLGGRVQNLYANGISRVSRSSILTADGYGQQIVPPTTAITFLRGNANTNYPVDDINHGDDIVQFLPSASDGFLFASQFASVRVGDILRVNYGAVEVNFIVLETKYIQGANDGYGSSTFIVRVNGKNLEYAITATASVNRPLVNTNKYGVLAMAPVSTTGINDNSAKVQPSLIIGSPQGAQALGVDFDATQFDTTHYLLYLGLYPTGNPVDGYLMLPPIDVTGNEGSTPGQYTLDSVVLATNVAFRQPGYNYRFIAFQYQGQFGMMLADAYNNSAFSIFSIILDSNGIPNPTATAVAFPNNVVGVIANANGVILDPLGFGPTAANIASPPYQSTFTSAALAIQPVKLFIPLSRNNYYVDGVEKAQMSLDVGQALDGYGDGYWAATVTNINVTTTVQITYSIPLDLSTSNLKPGKTLVVQSLGQGGTFPNDFGRYIIQDVSFGCVAGQITSTSITVFDAVHGVGISPSAVLSTGAVVAIYFDSTSVSFDAESATDFTYYSPFKRYFEVYVDEFANTFTHERGRTNIGNSNTTINTPPGTILVTGPHSQLFDIVGISPKLRGYQFGSVTKITLNIISFNITTGVYTGYLCSWNGVGSITGATNLGPLTTGKQGVATRFYDETEIDYIDINLSFDTGLNVSFNNEAVDIQLFSSLQLNQQIMILGSCQINTVSQVVNYLTDLRQFGNTSEEQLTTSALDFIAAPNRLLTENAIVRGFDVVSVPIPTFTALTGTFAVSNSLSTVTASTSQAATLNIGSIVTFSNNPGVTYTILSIVGGTAITLTTNFQGVSSSSVTATYATTFSNQLFFNGGTAMVNGEIIQMNNQSVVVPVLQEIISPSTMSVANNTITWFLCINDGGEYQLVASTDFNPNGALGSTYINAGLDENRLFYANNPNNIISPYVVRSTYLSDLIQNQKDLTLVGVVTVTVGLVSLNSIFTYQPISITYSDARRFIYNGYGGLSTPFVLGVNGSFRNFATLNTWLAQLTTLQSSFDNQNNVGLRVIVKGNTVLSTSVNLNYGKQVIFEGDGGIFTIPVTTGFTLGSNVMFRDIEFNYTFNPVGDGFYNTGLLSNINSAAIYCNVDPINGNRNITFENCLFVSSNQYRYAFISFNFSTSTCYAENILITNNRFETSFAADDQLAVVSFIGPVTSPTTGNGARLNNCVIESNFCNKNQLLLVAPTLVGSNILDLIAATNLRIVGNTCGAIDVMIKQDYPLSVYNTNFDLDKSNGAVISENTCKFIYSGFSNGNVNGPTNTTAINYIQNGFNLLVGNLIISSNNTSNIWTGYRTTASTILGNPIIIIRGNKLTAYNPAYLTAYNVTLVSSTLAIYIDKVIGT